MAEADIAGWKAVDREMYVVYPASRQLSPKVRAAVDYVLAQQAEQE
jgi:DNA-binding transcriptional LysR family regulator